MEPELATELRWRVYPSFPREVLTEVLTEVPATSEGALYFSHFAGAARFAETKAFAILHGTAITYASALAAPAVILWFFGRFAQHGLFLNVAQCVVLGIAGTLGASAGRLLLR